MDVNIENIDFGWKHATAILNVLKSILHYPTNPQRKAKLLDNTIFIIFESLEEGADTCNIDGELWDVFLYIASCIPPGHPWQDSLLQSLNNLRQRDHVYHGSVESWKNLPTLSMSVRENWDRFPPNINAGSSEEVRKEFRKWKNFNSFMARLISREFPLWLKYPIWQLREALEDPPHKGGMMDCQVWVATEWIIQCANILFEFFCSKEELDEAATRAFRTGSLCDDNKVPILSIERWNFWKERFSDIAADADNLGLDSTTTARIPDALKRMDEVAKK